LHELFRLIALDCARVLKSTATTTDNYPGMVYFFERQGSVMQCEIRVDSHGDGYELVIESKDSARVEHFREPTELSARWTELEIRLLSEGWAEPTYPRRS
jgi:hypothetical protein